MSTGLLIGHDEAVANHLFSFYSQPKMQYDRCLGLINSKGVLVGAVLFHNWNGSNVEISYYGENTMTPGIIRCLARFILITFDASRLTAVTSKRNKRFVRSLQNFGFKLEGVQRCYYGHQDCIRNTGVRLVMFRNRLEELAQFQTKQAQSC
jgi:RimJ/RimL family protein N-acetyltransferase